MNAPAKVLSVRNRRGSQREYETVLIIRPETPRPGIVELVERFRGILDKNGASVLKVENWGIRTLAYPIRNHKKGVYLYLRYLGGSATVTEFERNLRINDTVVRFLSVMVDDDVDPGARPSEVDPEALENIGDIGTDPLDRVPEPSDEPERDDAFDHDDDTEN